ncbi:MAG: peptidoglycan synthetase [Bacteroidales bacterium]|nr:peptidoglycan synthetase [Bacteroidales bacterium]
MRIHFIAIGGSTMHNLAIALYKQGHQITGSDDEIFEPSKGRLKKYGLLPEKTGWDENNIHGAIDAIILGMHAKKDNPELMKAEKLNLPVYSFPEYLYEHAKNKKRIVIGGSHGKTTITAMILHALNYHKIDVDYMVGAQLDGFEVMVRLSEEANIMVFEGDEYLTSANDPRPKFHVYKPHVALISGIAWDHFNVFPTFEKYVDQFITFIDLLPDDGSLVYYSGDGIIHKLVNEYDGKARMIPYFTCDSYIKNGKTIIRYNQKEYPMEIFGDHNMKNMQGAMLICREIGLSPDNFYKAMTKFKGASNRLEKIAENEHTRIFKDFAHSPSKVKATSEAVKYQFGDNELVAVLELHTYSSLNKDFLSQYSGTLNAVDMPIVFFNVHAIKLKRLPMLQKQHIYDAFDNANIKVFNLREDLEQHLKSLDWNNKNLLFMSSGNFDGMNKDKLSEAILKR